MYIWAFISIGCDTEEKEGPEEKPGTEEEDSGESEPLTSQCSLFQKSTYDAQPESYSDCAAVEIPYADIEPHSSNGHLWSRTVPACLDGTDGPCSGNEIRCIDGTRPYYHVDKAMDADGNPVDSNKWIFFFPGGGSCGQNTLASAAEVCATEYNTGSEAREMSTRHADPSLDAVPAMENTEGILDDDPSSYFGGFNRVEIYKCSYDRYMGNTTNVDPIEGITLYFHGRRMIEAVFQDLSRSRGVVSDATDGDLPALADATRILVSSNSGGSGGLIMNADWIKALLDDSTDAQIQFALDALIEPGIEAESHFEEGGSASDLYGGDFSGVSTLENDTTSVSITRGTTVFQPGGDTRLQFESRGDPASVSDPYMDASCFASHPTDDSSCFDEAHVLYHHAGVDRFMYLSLRDANHRNNSIRWVTSWTNSPDLFSWIPDSPEELQFTLEFVNRVIYTVDQFYRFRADSDDVPSAPVFDLAIMVPDHAQHVNITDNHYFKVASMSGTNAGGPVSYTFATALEKWMEEGGDAMIVDDGVATEKVAQGGGWSTTE